MDGELPAGGPGSVLIEGDAARQILAAAPPWAQGMKPRREADGRIFLVGETPDGCYLWVQPKAWSMMTRFSDAGNRGDGAAINYGLQMSGLASHQGRLETNDPGLGGRMLSASTGSESPLPTVPDRDLGPYAAPAAILAAGLVVVAFLFRRRRAA